MLLLICWLLVWAFVLSWISNIILKDEIPIKTSFFIILLTVIASVAYRQLVAGESTTLQLLGVVVDVVVMAGLLTAAVQAKFDKALIIAAIYAGTTFVFWMIVAAMLG